MSSKQAKPDAVNDVSLSLTAVPSSAALKASIIEQAQDMPQRVGAGKPPPYEGAAKSQRWFIPRWATMASGLAIVCLAVVLLIPTEMEQTVTLTSQQDVWSEDELALQELMLIEDELMFAQIEG